MSINIASFTFKTQGSIKDFIRSSLYPMMNNLNAEMPVYDLKKDETHEFFKELLKFNPEKKKSVEEKGLKNICVTRNPKNHTAFHTLLEFDDYSIEDISFLKCADMVKGRKKQDTTKADFLQCLRKSIDYQIQYFKLDKDKKCEKCSSKTRIEVDHIIKFRDLAQTFIKEENKVPDSSEIEHDKNNGGSKFKDDVDMVKKWQDYHLKHAQLRFLCKSCNLKEG